ncbi:hypothetical protein BJ322DRAFT_1196699 [Thelephora terrestris]|uniref:RNase H type-1 domain-containing protein n=1 Tax=Thelephora terrestris TaxID=56493 RepID=A0A9P6HBV2_9AGAM|nr:hypothetical protein BJ322DRAFT_1196699 [Thelephora terrestris]
MATPEGSGPPPQTPSFCSHFTTGGVSGASPFKTLETLPHNPKTFKQLSPLTQLSKRSNPKGERLFPFASECAPFIPQLTNTSHYPSFFLDPDPVGSSGSEEREGYASRINSLLNQRDKDKVNYIFCDGSYKSDRGGAAMVAYLGTSPALTTPDFQITVGTGQRSTAYDGEMLALVLASRRALLISRDRGLPREIVIYSDSSSALSNITLPGPHPG